MCAVIKFGCSSAPYRKPISQAADSDPMRRYTGREVLYTCALQIGRRFVKRKRSASHGYGSPGGALERRLLRSVRRHLQSLRQSPHSIESHGTIWVALWPPQDSLSQPVGPVASAWSSGSWSDGSSSAPHVPHLSLPLDSP